MSLVKLEQALGVAQFVVRNANAPVSVFVADATARSWQWRRWTALHPTRG
jgi:hypothetical protein